MYTVTLGLYKWGRMTRKNLKVGLFHKKRKDFIYGVVFLIR